jgi:nitroreductase
MGREVPTTLPDVGLVDDLLSTTRAVRRRLDLDRPVPLDLIRDCLELAMQAPTGGNRQGWRWVVVTDGQKKERLADLYRREAHRLTENRDAAQAAGHRQTARVYESAVHLADVLERVPALVIPCVEGRIETVDPVRMSSLYGAIYPAVWSFMLALRARGLGTALTTLHLFSEAEAAELLAIPPEITQVCLVPVAYATGDSFRPARRPPLNTVTFADEWGAPL